MSFTGIPVIYGISPHATSTTPLHQLGSYGVTSDGRGYRYAQAGAAGCAAGLIQMATDITANHEDLAVNTFAVGDREITVTLGATAITGNEYEEGFVNITDGTGQGILYKIAKCPATALSTDVVITLAEPIVVGAEAATTVTLVRNKYRDILATDGTEGDLPVGVPNVAIAADYYGWVQTKGYCSILVGAGDTTAGADITIDTTTAGGAETRATVERTVGVQPAGAGADVGEYGVFELTLD